MMRVIAEFEEQSFTQIIFPHKNSDWIDYLVDAQKTFVNIIKEIIKYQKCLVICDDIESVKAHFKSDKNLYFIEYQTDDTWARDCSAISMVDAKELKLLDFSFDGWGGKFESKRDNLMSRSISKHYSTSMASIPFVLEGGAIESNGDRVLLTTSKCMKSRNPTLNIAQTTQKLKEFFNLREVLYLHHGYLAGDDTDSHIDTLARFVDRDKIVYVKCEDREDEHFDELYEMEKELELLASTHNFKLIPLPMSDAIYFQGERLPATYANFLFLNGAILVPTYGVKQDREAMEIFKGLFKSRDVIGIDCQTLIRQHGSLHCVTMNFASGVTILV